MTAIEVNNYQVSYNEGAEPILQDCSLTLDYGEFVLLSGLSGSGKSTLLSSINGIIPGAVFGIQQGDILVDGESIRGKENLRDCKKSRQRPSERGQPDCACPRGGRDCFRLREPEFPQRGNPDEGRRILQDDAD